MRSPAARIGFHASLTACSASVAFSIVQTLQLTPGLPKPLDEILIYGSSLLIATPYLLAMVALHATVPDHKKVWTHAAIVFGVLYCAYVSLNYVVQLATVVPARLQGTISEIALLDQTPHSLFWDVDALGYIFLGFSTLTAALALDTRERWLRRFLVANAAITPVIGFVYFYPRFSIPLLLLGIPWLITVPGSLVLLTRHFQRLARADEGITSTSVARGAAPSRA